MENSVQIINLSKSYKHKLAVKNLNFKIDANKIIGLLGPNGCGKTTTIAMILGLIKPTENFKLGLAAATGGIAIVYLANFIMSFFGSGIPLMDINNSSMYSIGFSVFVIIIAAMNLVVDFDFIEEGAEKGAPKYMEWFGAFGLMVTLIWLYLEILKLLAKMNSRK